MGLARLPQRDAESLGICRSVIVLCLKTTKSQHHSSVQFALDFILKQLQLTPLVLRRRCPLRRSLLNKLHQQPWQRMWNSRRYATVFSI